MSESFKITNIISCIYNGVQWIEIYLDGLTTKEGKDFLTFEYGESSAKKFGITIEKIELLIGSFLELEFFFSHEHTGRPIHEHYVLMDDRTIKSIKLKHDRELEKEREKLLMFFLFIECATRYWIKNMMMVRLVCAPHPSKPNPTNFDFVIYIPTKRFLKLTGLQIWEVSMIRGALIHFTFYKIGEICPDLGFVYKSNRIVKDLIIRVDDSIEHSYKKGEGWPIKTEYQPSIDYEPRRNSNQHFIEDALGGEESAAWNLD